MTDVPRYPTVELIHQIPILEEPPKNARRPAKRVMVENEFRTKEVSPGKVVTTLLPKPRTDITPQPPKKRTFLSQTPKLPCSWCGNPVMDGDTIHPACIAIRNKVAEKKRPTL